MHRDAYLPFIGSRHRDEYRFFLGFYRGEGVSYAPRICGLGDSCLPGPRDGRDIYAFLAVFSISYNLQGRRRRRK